MATLSRFLKKKRSLCNNNNNADLIRAASNRLFTTEPLVDSPKLQLPHTNIKSQVSQVSSTFSTQFSSVN